MFLPDWGGVVFEEGFDWFVLFVELGEVGDEVFDDVHYKERSDTVWRREGGRPTVRKRVNLLRLALGPIDPTQTSQRINTINVHRAAPANPFTAWSSECECRVKVVLDLDKGVEDHGSAFCEV
jgi:hypothetical protein